MRVCQEEDTFRISMGRDFSMGPGPLFCAFCDLRKAGEGDGDVVVAASGQREIDESLTGIVD